MELSSERKPRVVVVDDHPQVLSVLGRILVASCDVVASVSSGAAAVDAVVRLRPDVLVADLMLPDIDGVDVCRRVKQLAPETVVVITTASDDEAIRTAALRSGASAFVPKHRVADTLPCTIAQAFAGVPRRT